MRNFVVLGIIGLTGLGIIPPWPQSGIYCDDASIRFKYQGDSVPTLYLILGLLIPPLCLVRKTTSNYLQISLLLSAFVNRSSSLKHSIFQSMETNL